VSLCVCVKVLLGHGCRHVLVAVLAGWYVPAARNVCGWGAAYHGTTYVCECVLCGCVFAARVQSVCCNCVLAYASVGLSYLLDCSLSQSLVAGLVPRPRTAI
jgi:hypothetical protein